MRSNRALAVGETDGEYVGCYLFGIEATAHEPTSYQSLATTRNELIADCRSFFLRLMEMKKEVIARPRPLLQELGDLAYLMSDGINARHKQDLASIEFVLNNIDRYIDVHLSSGAKKPFWEGSGMALFLRIGSRQREIRNGKYLE